MRAPISLAAHALVACLAGTLAGCIVVTDPARSPGSPARPATPAAAGENGATSELRYGADPHRPVPAANSVPSSEGPPCMLDPTDGRLKQCHHVTGDGRCAHYGAWCDASNAGASPAASSPCLLDTSDGRYKQCHHVTGDGRCAHFGAWCDASQLGSSPCLMDPATSTYKQCHHVTTDGRCAHYGAACQP